MVFGHSRLVSSLSRCGFTQSRENVGVTVSEIVASKTESVGVTPTLVTPLTVLVQYIVHHVRLQACIGY